MNISTMARGLEGGVVCRCCVYDMELTECNKMKWRYMD